MIYEMSKFHNFTVLQLESNLNKFLPYLLGYGLFSTRIVWKHLQNSNIKAREFLFWSCSVLEQWGVGVNGWIKTIGGKLNF